MIERSRPSAVAEAPRLRATTPRSHALGRAGRRQRRRRRVAGLVRLVVFLLLIFIAVWAGVRVANASVDGRAYTGDPYMVRQGDDLWTIAAVHYGDRIDLRKAVYIIREANQLDSSAVQPGEQLQLPYLEE